MRNYKIVCGALAALLVATPVLASEVIEEIERPWFWSVAVPLPVPTQVGVFYSLADKDPMGFFANAEVGRFYTDTRSLSFQIRPGVVSVDDTSRMFAHLFAVHRWNLLPGREELFSYDRDAIVLGAGLGGYAVPKAKTPSELMFGPAVDLKLIGWTSNSNRAGIRGVFEADLVVGLLGDKADVMSGIINKRASGFGVTLGFWMPADWYWLFPET